MTDPQRDKLRTQLESVLSTLKCTKSRIEHSHSTEELSGQILRTEALLARTAASPADINISICPRCEGCGIHNFSSCSICNGTGRLDENGEAFAGASPASTPPTDALVIEIARELYDRFMMGGWEPQDAHDWLREMLTHE